MERRGEFRQRRRIREIAGLVPEGSRAADIGTDHGLLPFALLAEGRVDYCLATETSERRLQPVRQRLRKSASPRGTIDLRVGDGLASVTADDRIDVVVLAGMGTATIRRILSETARPGIAFRRVVIQSQTGHTDLRKWLLRHGYAIVDERVVETRGRFYPILAAEPSPCPRLELHPKLSPEEVLEVGPCLLRSSDPTLSRMWERERRRVDHVVSVTPPGPDRDAAESRRDLAVRVLANLRPRSAPCGKVPGPIAAIDSR